MIPYFGGGGGETLDSHVDEENEVGRADGDDVDQGLERHQVHQLVQGKVEMEKEVAQEKPGCGIVRRRFGRGGWSGADLQ